MNQPYVKIPTGLAMSLFMLCKLRHRIENQCDDVGYERLGILETVLQNQFEAWIGEEILSYNTPNESIMVGLFNSLKQANVIEEAVDREGAEAKPSLTKDHSKMLAGDLIGEVKSSILGYAEGVSESVSDFFKTLAKKVEEVEVKTEAESGETKPVAYISQSELSYLLNGRTAMVSPFKRVEDIELHVKLVDCKNA